MENLNNVPSTGTFGGSVSKINSNFDLVVNAINSLEYQTTRSKGILNYGQNPATVFPNAVEGDWCMILSEGNVFPATIKTFNGSTWSGSGTWNPDGVDLTGYATTSAMNTAIANSLAQATARMGYGECTVNGTTLTVSIPNFILPTSGGTIHIKMSAVGTGASTLNINSTGAKTLWYNGAAVSAQNTWEAGEIISAFYDGTKYMSSNSQGGGGDAEKIKYDNSLSGLASNNVQGALDEVADDVYGTNPIHESIAPTNNENQGANRWLLRWYNVLKNGDLINISCRTGYEVSVFLYDVGTATIIKSYTNSTYQNSLSITYEDGENQDFRVLVRKSNNGNISSGEVIANVTYSVTRYVYRGGLVGDVADLQNDVSNINGDINSLDGRVDTIEQDMQSSQVNILPTMGTNYFEISINNNVTPNIFDTLHSTTSSTYQSVLIPAIRGKRYVIEVSATQYAGFALIKNSNPSVGDNVVYPDGQEMHYTNLTAGTYTFDVTEDGCYFFVRNDIGANVRTWPQKFYYENNQARFIERSELLNEVVPNSDEPVKSSAVYNFASKKEIKILFIGNSLTQDATMWLPYVLRNIGTGIKYTLINMYNGGYTLTQQWTKINGGQKFEIASVCDNANGWTNYNNSKTLDDMLSVCEFDYLVLQEYYNYKASAEDTDLSAFNNIVDYVMNRVSHPFEVVTLIHAPKRDDATTIYNRTVAGNQLILRETCATSLINIGTAIYEALDTDLDSLGTQGHLSPDGTHAQEGLPCILEALNLAMWIYEKLGIAGGVVNFQFSPTPSSIYSSLNVAGANGSVIDGTTAQQQLTTKVAADSYKKNLVIFMEAFING